MANPPIKQSRLGRGLSSLIGRPVSVTPAPGTPPAPDNSPENPTGTGNASTATAPPLAPAAPASSTANGDAAGATPVGGSPGATRSAAAPAGASSQASPAPADAMGIVYLPVQAIIPNPHQPRQRFDQAALQHLADSIKSEGLMQPIIVRPITAAGSASSSGATGNAPTGAKTPAPAPAGASGTSTASPSQQTRSTWNVVSPPAGIPGSSVPGATAVAVQYELVAGERRWRAVQLAGLTVIPAVVRPLSDRQVAEWALVENLQREDLNPIERAEAFLHLIRTFEVAQDDLADRLGLDRSTVSNHLRLLVLDEKVRVLISDGLLSMGQAKVLLSVANPVRQKVLAVHAVHKGWPVRQLERAVKELAAGRSLSEVVGQLHASDAAAEAAYQAGTLGDASSGGAGADGVSGGIDEALGKRAPAPRSAHFRDIEDQLAKHLGMRVRLRPGRRKGAGTVSIAFKSIEDFDRLAARLGVSFE